MTELTISKEDFYNLINQISKAYEVLSIEFINLSQRIVELSSKVAILEIKTNSKEFK